MTKFKKYQRTQVAEMRPVTIEDIRSFEHDKKSVQSLRDVEFRVSISAADLNNGSPKIGDMIARNPKNHNDQWLVAQEYFKDNFASTPVPNSEEKQSVEERRRVYVDQFRTIASMWGAEQITTSKATELINQLSSGELDRDSFKAHIKEIESDIASITPSKEGN